MPSPAALPISTEVTLKVDNITHYFETRSSSQDATLKDTNLELHDREIVGILGRSGCGKSTLLRIICGLITPSSGRVLYNGEQVSGPTPGIAMVFQTFALFPWLTVLENVMIGLQARGTKNDEAEERAIAAIDRIGLDGFESAYPRELSGGMRQRVGFARALVTDPKILLMDEPFSALDVLTAESLRSDLISLWTDRQISTRSILIITHNIEEAVSLCDRVLVFEANPGRIAHEVNITLPHPRNRHEPSFQNQVDDLYEIMTARPNKDRRTAQLKSTTMELPEATNTSLYGFIQAVLEPPFYGKADLPLLAEEINMQTDSLFPLIEAAQILGFAVAGDGDVAITPAGRVFCDADILQRKQLFGESLRKNIPLATHIFDILATRPDHRASRYRFETELEDSLSPEAAEQTLHRIIDWGRFGEVFAYDDESETFYLELDED